MVTKSKNIIFLSILCCLFFCCICEPTLAQNDVDITQVMEQAKDAGVSEEVLNRILALGYKHNVKAKEMADFLHIVKQAREEDLPEELLVNKIEEGFAKGVHTRIINQALRQESSQYLFARRILYKLMNRWGIPNENLDSGEFVRLGRTISMGISEQEIEEFFKRTPQAPITEIVNAVEFLAALRQSGLDNNISEEITFIGLQNRFFSKTTFNLVSLVNVAKRNKVPEKEISSAIIEIIMGRKNIREAYMDLGLDLKGQSKGSLFSHTGNSEKANGKASTGGGKDDSSGPGGAGGSNGSGGSGGDKGGGKH